MFTLRHNPRSEQLFLHGYYRVGTVIKLMRIPKTKREKSGVELYYLENSSKTLISRLAESGI